MFIYLITVVTNFMPFSNGFSYIYLYYKTAEKSQAMMYHDNDKQNQRTLISFLIRVEDKTSLKMGSQN